MTVAWPLRADGRPMMPVDIALSLVSLTRSGGQAYAGPEQIVASPNARWEASLRMPALRPDEIIVWRGFLARMQGRVETVVMPAFEAGRQPWPIDQFGRVLHPGLARQPERAAPYAVDLVLDAQADILVTAGAKPINATTLILTVGQGGVLAPGHRFSIGTRLHEITTVTLTGAVGPIRTYAVTIRPWLRFAIGEGTVVEFRNPVCLMRFKTDGEGALMLESNRIARPELNLVEVEA